MKFCQTITNSTGRTCAKCGALPAMLHSPLIRRGVFCERCCTVCAPAAVPAGGVVAKMLSTLGLQARPRVEAWRKAGWPDAGLPRPKDPFYFDERRDATRLRRGR